MEAFQDYTEQIENPCNRRRLEEILNWTARTFPTLKARIAWNQPMFTDHGTFIIGFSTAKHHLSVAPERKAIERFTEAAIQAGYSLSKELLRIRWEQPVDYQLLEKIIRFNMEDKADCSSFWRK